MLSKLLLRVSSISIWYIFLLYVCALVIIVTFGAAALRATYFLQQNASLEEVTVQRLLIQSTANTLGFSSFDLNVQSQAFIVTGMLQGFIGIFFNGIFVALIVFRVIRINHKALVFANHVLLSQQTDGNWRLEFRICNDSKYDIINVTTKVQLVEYLESFPNTTADKTINLLLNFNEYLLLKAHGYLLVSSACYPKNKKIGVKITKIDESLLSHRFYFRIMIQGQYQNSGFLFSEFRIYEASQVHKGHWRYYLQEDLEKRQRLIIEKFNAFDAPNTNNPD